MSVTPPLRRKHVDKSNKLTTRARRRRTSSSNDHQLPLILTSWVSKDHDDDQQIQQEQQQRQLNQQKHLQWAHWLPDADTWGEDPDDSKAVVQHKSTRITAMINPTKGYIRKPSSRSVPLLQTRQQQQQQLHGYQLTPMDERILVLCRSAIQARTNNLESPVAAQPTATRKMLLVKYGHEADHAALKIQKTFRGFLTRRRISADDGPKFQLAARKIQFFLRSLLVRKRVLQRVFRKLTLNATRIQAWYRGCVVRERLLDDKAQWLNRCISIFQRVIRARRFWILAMDMLHQHRSQASLQIQRVYRGFHARRVVKQMRYDRLHFARQLEQQSQLHRTFVRCPKCCRDSGTNDEQSLLQCLMVRFTGLHDFDGAKALALEGLNQFPLSAKFHFFYGLLLLATCDQLEIAMTYLRRATHLGMDPNDLEVLEVQFFLSAIQLHPNDAVAFFDLALLAQCRDQMARAEILYRKALEFPATQYEIPGYLHRVEMRKRLLQNYRVFSSLFNFQPKLVLIKTLSLGRFGADKKQKVRFSVYRFNFFTAILPTEESNWSRFNTVYLSNDELEDRVNEYQLQAEQAANGQAAMMLKQTKQGSWRNSKSRRMQVESSASTRRSSFSNKSIRKISLGDLSDSRYQSTNDQLHILPLKQALQNEARQRTKLSKETAERLLKEVEFVLPSEQYVNAQHHARVSVSEAVESDTADAQEETESSVNEEETESRPSTSGDPASTLSSALPTTNEKTKNHPNDCVFLHRVVLIPSIIKKRLQESRSKLTNFASLQVQRVYRGFVLRAHLCHEHMLQEIQLAQRNQLRIYLDQIHSKRARREQLATRIQRFFRGYLVRKHLLQIIKAASDLQRCFRGYRGRRRAQAFRDGNMHFVQAERVFQRGVTVSGRCMMLVIEKSGLSFRFDGHDLEACQVYHGFQSNQSTMRFLTFLNWETAMSLIGTSFAYHGVEYRVHQIVEVDATDALIRVECIEYSTDIITTTTTTTTNNKQTMVLELTELIRLLNVHRYLKGITTELDMPFSSVNEQLPRLIKAMIARLALVPAIKMPTFDLKQRGGGAAFNLSVVAPPGMNFITPLKRYDHLLGSSPASSSSDSSRAVSKTVASTMAKMTFLVPKGEAHRAQMAFPVADGLRGVSIGKQFFRRKCQTHNATFTRCRCILPVVSVPAYVDAISRALEAPATSSPS